MAGFNQPLNMDLPTCTSAHVNEHSHLLQAGHTCACSQWLQIKYVANQHTATGTPAVGDTWGWTPGDQAPALQEECVGAHAVNIRRVMLMWIPP